MSTLNLPPEPGATSTLQMGGQPETHKFSFHGEGVSLSALVLKNMLLTLVSFGIYLPWAKTERRKYIWQNIEVGGHRLRYHGTGKELLIGYLKVILAYALFIGVIALSKQLFGPTGGVVAQVVMMLLVIPLIPYAIWGSQRYLLSRTSWRGIRFHLDGSATPYAKNFFLGYLLTLVTLGLYGPVWLNNMRRISVNASALGTRSFEYRGENSVVFKLGLKGFFLSLLTFGIYSFWYRAELSRYQFSQTHFDGAHAELNITGSDFLVLTLLQVFGITLSLGFAFPFITVYSLQFVLQRMRLVGPIDFARIYQAPAMGDAVADGLADVLDVGPAL